MSLRILHRAIGLLSRGRFARASIIPAVLLGVLLGGCTHTPSRIRPHADRAELKEGRVEAKRTRGAPYPAAPPSDRVPNEDHEGEHEPVPTGPKVGDMKPASPATRIRDARRTRGGRNLIHPAAHAHAPPELTFKAYQELQNSVSAASDCCPEISVAENGQTIMMTGNKWMALSEDGGATFSSIDPTTIFPQSDAGFCCDQVVVYIPSLDMFVWVLQYWWDANGNNRLRLAAQTTAQVRSSNGTSWTYWDFQNDLFHDTEVLDYSDLSVGDRSLWWAFQIAGRVVVRIDLDELAAQGDINYQYTGPTTATGSHLSQNANGTVYWAGHVTNSEMRVYSMVDGEDFYSWRSVAVNSWPNGASSATCPSGQDFMESEAFDNYVFGSAVQGQSVWFSWLASAGGGFPQPHVQMVRINPSTWTREEQVQIWNPTIAFQDASLSTNSQGELGMEIAFGGNEFFPSSASGVWGDYVVYYPRLSTRCMGRWGDYNHSRRSGSNPAEWVAGGYTRETNASGVNIVIPHYVRFGR